MIFDIYENNAYDIEQELKASYPNLNLKVLIGSVRDSKRINWVFETYKPEIVYHAAAHKHVPLMENSPCEAIKNNVVGTYKTAWRKLQTTSSTSANPSKWTYRNSSDSWKSWQHTAKEAMEFT